MGDGIKAAIREAGSPLGPPDLRQKLEAAGFSDKLHKNPNYLYTVIFRLARRGEIVRDGDRYRLPHEGDSSGDDSSEGVAGGSGYPRELTLN